jgi:hypothetical protein
MISWLVAAAERHPDSALPEKAELEKHDNRGKVNSLILEVSAVRLSRVWTPRRLRMISGYQIMERFQHGGCSPRDRVDEFQVLGMDSMEQPFGNILGVANLETKLVGAVEYW